MIILAYAFCTDYGNGVVASGVNATDGGISAFYPMFQVCNTINCGATFAFAMAVDAHPQPRWMPSFVLCVRHGMATLTTRHLGGPHHSPVGVLRTKIFGTPTTGDPPHLPAHTLW